MALRSLPISSVALLALVGLSGCDALTDSSDEGSVHGTWTRAGASFVEYLEITSGTLTSYYSETGGCFEGELYTIQEKDGDQYTLHPALSSSSETITVTLRRQGDNLTLALEGVTVTYQPSDQDVDQLEICVAGAGDDPAIVCSALPAVTPGQAINGELTTADGPGDDGRYFDLFGLTLASQTTVQIDARSDPVDTYLYLYTSDGSYIAENDDASDATFDARIATTLQAGCYRIEVTSWGAAETGTYTLEVN